MPYRNRVTPFIEQSHFKTLSASKSATISPFFDEKQPFLQGPPADEPSIPLSRQYSGLQDSAPVRCRVNLLALSEMPQSIQAPQQRAIEASQLGNRFAAFLPITGGRRNIREA